MVRHLEAVAILFYFIEPRYFHPNSSVSRLRFEHCASSASCKSYFVVVKLSVTQAWLKNFGEPVFLSIVWETLRMTAGNILLLLYVSPPPRKKFVYKTKLKLLSEVSIWVSCVAVSAKKTSSLFLLLLACPLSSSWWSLKWGSLNLL